MKRLILLLTAFCIAEIGFSQTDYRNGYIITNARDTVIGLIDYREGIRSYRSCSFKSSKDLNVVAYKPTDIVGYGFENDKFFLSREITNKEQPSKIVFLEVIVKGLVSLYRFEGRYFIEKDNSGLQQLMNETIEVFVDGKRQEKNTNQYIGIINMMVFDCAEIRSRVQKIRFIEKELTNLVEDYNQCKGEHVTTFKAKKQWTKVIIGMTGGVNFSQLSFKTQAGYIYLAGNFKYANSPMVGISLDILSPRLSERISFHSDLLYLNSNYYNYKLYTGSSSIERNYVTIGLQQLKMPIGIRYTFPKREFTSYVNLGVSSTIHMSPNSNWIQEIESNNVVRTNENEALIIKNNQLGLWGGFGVSRSINHKFNVFMEVRYEQTNGIVPFSVDLQGLNSKITNIQILIGIRTK